MTEIAQLVTGERGDANEPEVLSSSAIMTTMVYPSRNGLRNLSRTELPSIISIAPIAHLPCQHPCIP
mgnify:FL=1